MSRLPVVDFRIMDRVLRHLGFQPVRQGGAISSIDTPMAEQPLSRIIQDVDLARPLLREILREIDLSPE